MDSIKETVGLAIVMARLDTVWATLVHAPVAEIHADVPPSDRTLIAGLGIAAQLLTIPLVGGVVVLALAALGVIG